MSKTGKLPATRRATPRASLETIRRPVVLINMSLTVDGKIATANRRVSSFGSDQDQVHLYELRSTVDAVMSGARTVEAGAVDLDAGGARFEAMRRARGMAVQNLRVIVSGSGTLNPRAHIFRKRGSPLLLITREDADAGRLSRFTTRVDAVGRFGRGKLDLEAALKWLFEEWGVRRLLCEGGGELNGSLLKARLVDEVHLTVCPFIFGGNGAPTIAGGDVTHRLADAVPCQLKSIRGLRDELFLVYRVANATRRATLPP
jgi:riboflavin-specific deaminase-like protein